MRANLIFLPALVSGYCSVSGVYAQEPDVGAVLFADSCSACHGPTGLGDGDMASVVSIAAPNLTLLSQRNGGEFPMLKVLQVIDGRTGVRAHGGVMPVWGQIFSEETVATSGLYGSVLEVRGRILSIATYLQSIQK